MYLNQDLKHRVTKSVWLKHVANRVYTLVEDLIECECSLVKTFRGMVDKVFNEARVQPHEKVEIMHIAIDIANKKGEPLLVQTLRKIRV